MSSVLRLARKAVAGVKSTLTEVKLSQSPFYRRYPYRGRIPLWSADLRGMTAVDHGFFFNRVPKAANSTIATSLATACGLREIQHDPEGNWAKQAFPRPSQLTGEQVDRLTQTYKFTFVRNPYARILSAYLDKVQRKGKVQGLSSFTEFCRYIDGGGLLSNIHWAPQTAIMTLPVERFDFIGKVENLERDLIAVLDAIGLPRPAQIERAGPPSTRSSTLLEEYYTPEGAEIVTRLYGDDFDIFGYERVARW